MSDTMQKQARLWRLVLRDGRELGFAEHDRDLIVNGRLYRAALAQNSSEISEKLGLDGGDSENFGAVDHALITYEDLENGVYDGAKVYRLLYDWSAGVLVDEAFGGWVDGVDYDEFRYKMRLRRSHPALMMRTGRSFVTDCDAELGDHRCKLDLVARGFYVDSTVEAGGADHIDVIATTPEPGYLAGGVVVFDRNETRRLAVADDVDLGGVRRLSFDETARFDIVAGLGVRVYWGCNRRFEQCVERFDNGRNFRGFPHLPTSLHVKQ